MRNTIISGLGGGNSDDECIDLMEIVAILMIPTLLKAFQVEVNAESLSEKLVPPAPNLLQSVLNMILEDVGTRSTALFGVSFLSYP